MSVLKAAIKFICAINRWIGEILSYFLFIIFILLFAEVLLRYLFNSPTVWTNELSQMLFGSYVILCGGYILLGGGHVNVDILFSRFSKRTKAGLDLITSILFFLFCGMLLIYGGSLAFESLGLWEHSESAWNPPIYPVKLMIPLGALLLILQGIAKFIIDVFIVFGKEPPVTFEAEEGESI
jgi:TRAP-type mannitol/chloroaromatic compound transport system permease small subunit